MIKAVIFDLDGTLIQTEVLKAESYARAIAELTGGKVSLEQTLNEFNRFVGLSRQEVVQGLASHFQEELETASDDKPELSEKKGESRLENLGERLIDKRLEIYRAILADTALLSRHFCSYTLGLFHRLGRERKTRVLATMSHLPEAQKVTAAMGIFHEFDLICTRDDVQNGKPAPDIYLKVQEHLGLETDEFVVIEDSVNGIRAAQNAGMPVFAVTNDITRKSVHDCDLLPPYFVVDDLRGLEDRVLAFITNASQDPF